ncbi:MAG: tRNA (adenosine(37)-N6)-threonylcarbamoyltransferase complex transferase subunit TsaD [Planctomycetota bacterium]|nr:tRNA (adenosine(37)-N6)-threonylcarbamoyltransferase complex transferase subunit TsaD [Planctomycetota bacterium]
MKKPFICLGIETSCDETATSVVADGKKVLSNIVRSQVSLHKEFGGVVPEIASRAHIECIIPLMNKALKDAQIKPSQITAVAVTNRPGLIGALLVGLSVAKTLAWLLNKPLIPVNHIQAHLYVNNLVEELSYPYVGLVVSGGHTTLFLVKSPGKNYQVIGRTRDDAAGESFDKVAKMLNLGYPGGPVIEKTGLKGNPIAIKFPRGFVSPESLDFSFSGLKTAVLYYCKGQNANLKTPLKKGLNIPDICASFQEAVVDTLLQRTFSVPMLHRDGQAKVKAIVLGGGVAANQRLRKRFQEVSEGKAVKLYLPPKKLCTDNAVMVAALGYAKYRLSASRLPSGQAGIGSYKARHRNRRELYLDAFSTADE